MDVRRRFSIDGVRVDICVSTESTRDSPCDIETHREVSPKARRIANTRLHRRHISIEERLDRLRHNGLTRDFAAVCVSAVAAVACREFPDGYLPCYRLCEELSLISGKQSVKTQSPQNISNYE